MNTKYMITIMQCYIHHKKGVEVIINPPINTRQSLLLQAMYSVASNYIKII